MIEEVEFRIVGPEAYSLISEYAAKEIASKQKIGDSIPVYEVRVPMHSDLISKLNFEMRSNSYRSDKWFVSFYQVHRKYSKEEILEAPYIHLRPVRTYVENLSSLDHLSLRATAGTMLPNYQISPIVLCGRIRTKDDIIALPEGSWLCKGNIAKLLRRKLGESIQFLPVFHSNLAREQWSKDRQTIGNAEACYLAESELNEWDWVQFVLPKGQCRITQPTDCSVLFQRSVEPQKRTPDVVGTRQLSELFLECTTTSTPEWSLTQNFIGSAGGLYLPMRQLIIKPKWIELLEKLRHHSLEIDRANVVASRT